jgi:hypothetical protein
LPIIIYKKKPNAEITRCERAARRLQSTTQEQENRYRAVGLIDVLDGSASEAVSAFLSVPRCDSTFASITGVKASEKPHIQWARAARRKPFTFTHEACNLLRDI